MNIREALRLKAAGLNNTQIASSSTVNAARSTIVELFKRCDQAGLDDAAVQDMSDSELQALLYPHNSTAGRTARELNLERWYQEVAEGRQRMDCWETYISEQPGGISYPQFCRRLKQYSKDKGTDLSYPKLKRPGEVMETDWAGDTLPIIYDQTQACFIEAYFFVATIGFSGKLFCRAYPNEQMPAWLDAHSRALEAYGGIPRIVTPDNTRTAIKKSHRYEPTTNPGFMSWAVHYSVAIIPARVAKPRDKNQTEGGVWLLESKILPKLKGQIFFDFESLNQELARLTEKQNRKPYQQRPGSRSDIFTEFDQPQLRQLPAHRFELPETKWATVSRNGYHVRFDDHRYSVPFQFSGKRVLISATSTVVELLYDNRRIAQHRRCYSHSQVYITNPSHMPEAHQHQLKADCMNGEKYRAWAAGIGEAALEYISALLARHVIEEQAYETCMGILRLADKYSEPMLEAACSKALKLGIGGYHQIKALLQALQEEQDADRLNTHSNLRGAAYYTEGKEHVV